MHNRRPFTVSRGAILYEKGLCTVEGKPNLERGDWTPILSARNCAIFTKLLHL